MNSQIPASWIFDGMHAAKLEEALAEGIKAYVELYYRNYTDADSLGGVDHLRRLLDEVEAGLDLEELVVEAETAINENGGIVGTDGKRHKVCTFEDEEGK